MKRLLCVVLLLLVLVVPPAVAAPVAAPDAPLLSDLESANLSVLSTSRCHL